MHQANQLQRANIKPILKSINSQFLHTVNLFMYAVGRSDKRRLFCGVKT